MDYLFSYPVLCILCALFYNSRTIKATSQPVSGDVRLVNGAAINEGRVEIFHDGAWGTVCDDGWDLNNGRVVCRQLGFTEAIRVELAAAYGEGSDRILLDDINCEGYEEALSQCSHTGWGIHNCAHSEDAGVVCARQQVTTPVSFSVRLVDGPSTNKGRLEIYHDGQWGTVCDDNWSMENANVVCRQLGWVGALRQEGGGVEQYGPGTGAIVLDDVVCDGTEASIIQCLHSEWGRHDCTHGEDVGVTCTDIGVRLVGGSSSTEGRVEVLYHGMWGSVCDDGWDLNEATVVCRQLGLGPATGAPPNAHFGSSEGPILLDQVECSGDELDLLQCIRADWGVHNCQHNEDAGVTCSGQETRVVGPGLTKIRLVDGASLFEGRVEVFYNNEWGTVCDDSWTIEDGSVACRQLGYGDVISVEERAFFGPGTGSVLLDELQCIGFESSLGECSSRGWTIHDCGHAEDAGVVCDWPVPEVTPEEHSVRLVGGGMTSEGRVEIFHNGQWGTVCNDGWDMTDANVVCGMLGFSGALRVEMDALFGPGAGAIWLDDVLCTDADVMLAECANNGWGRHDCTHSEDAGVVCVPVVGLSSGVPSGSVRLVGGSSPLEGRVEINIAGTWGTICAHGWDLMDANVLCHQLGFGNAIRADGGASFGQGTGEVFLENVACVGNENMLTDCPSDGDRSIGCDHEQDAGAVCGDEEPSTHVRLVGGVSPSEGRVEVFHDGAWGTICDSAWDINDGRVICRQLGFSDVTSIKDRAFYGQGSGPVFLADVDCDGTESAISKCRHPAWYEVQPYCSHNRDAGVMCRVSISDGYLNVRLSNSNNAHNTLEGRVEVYQQGVWGSVCGRNFDLNAAAVVCRQLGFAGAVITRNFAYYGEGTGPIHLSDVDCRGQEYNLGSCPHAVGSADSCTHAEDAGVVCLAASGNAFPFTSLEMIIAGSVVVLIFIMVIVLVVVCWRCRQTNTNDRQTHHATPDASPVPMHRLRRRRSSTPNEYGTASYSARRCLPSENSSPYESCMPTSASCGQTFAMGDYEPMDGKSKALHLSFPKEPPPYSRPLGTTPEYPPEYPPPPSPRPKCFNSFATSCDDSNDPFSIYQEVDEYLIPGTKPTTNNDLPQEHSNDVLRELSTEEVTQNQYSSHVVEQTEMMEE